jgi:hypothetical protein
VVDLLVNVKKAMALEILSTYLEELRSERVNPLAAIHGGNNIN